jgi:hypothetical protein
MGMQKGSRNRVSTSLYQRGRRQERPVAVYKAGRRGPAKDDRALGVGS